MRACICIFVPHIYVFMSLNQRQITAKREHIYVHEFKSKKLVRFRYWFGCILRRVYPPAHEFASRCKDCVSVVSSSQ